MKVIVDMELCESHGQCEFAAPEVFSLDDEADLHFVEEPEVSEADNVARAVRVCPTRAIQVAE